MRKAFTLIEMMISVVILSIIILFLYESYAALNRSNSFYKKRSHSIKNAELSKQILFLDFYLALGKSVKIINKNRDEDVVFLQTSHSLHKRINPYVAYIVKEKKLFRLESLKELKKYPFGIESDFVVDTIGEVKSFKVYKSSHKESEKYLIHIDFKNLEDVLLAVKVLNEVKS